MYRSSLLQQKNKFFKSLTSLKENQWDCQKKMIIVHENIIGKCPGGFCDHLLQFSEALAILLLADGFVFLVTLIPPLFTWKNKKPDSKKRVFFAVFACLTFYFWLTVLAINSLYCFGFLSYAGPCNTSSSPASSLPHVSSSNSHNGLAKINPLHSEAVSDSGNNTVINYLDINDAMCSDT